MSSTAAVGRADAAQRPRAAAPSSRARPLDPGELAWIAAPPCALLTLLALVALGPPLAHLVLMPRPGVLWPTIDALPQPEQHGRFLIGLLGPPLLAAAVLVLGREG